MITMSTRQLKTACLLILIGLIPELTLAQSQRGRLLGKIVDPDGKPIPGVAVTVTSPEVPDFKATPTTNNAGMFIVDFRRIGVPYEYRFDKAGYQSLTVTQDWSLAGTGNFEWKMTPVTTVALGGAAPPSTSQQAVAAYNAGVGAAKAKEYAMAEAKFGEAVRHDPNLVPAWVALASLQVQTGHNKEAAEAAEKAIALGSTEEAVLMARYQAYRNLKDEAKAAEALKDLERIGRRAEEARKIHNEAVELVKAGDDAGAFARFQEALKVDPTLQPSLLGLAAAGVKIGRHAEAAAAAETVLKTEPANEQALRLRYNAALNLGDQDKLFEALVGLAAVERDVANKGLQKLAFDAYDANDKVRAKARFLKVLDLDPNQPLPHYYLGLLYAGEGANAQARTHLERFLALAPNNQAAPQVREMLKQLPKQ
jgi:Tfp pilus assembly protein PilF